ncbi:MAG: FAD:protein FMN transferase [Calditrichaeota bacterium]|nr:FAD:protein FMN transferase [Calditrichota bacterium]MCB9365760.1 FAD:protein FMN transferase [Calditrichota bacterium]
MGGPCEILIETRAHRKAAATLELAAAEAWRIEEKFSRYLSDSVVQCINRSSGVPVHLDSETARLLSYAHECHALSNGMFDITSGVLRRAWKFDGSDRIPEQCVIDDLLPLIGWEKTALADDSFTLPAGMEIDLGGIGKEYAVDRAASLIEQTMPQSFVVNFGGDLLVSGTRESGKPWRIGLDDPNLSTEDGLGMIQLAGGGLATSGDARRFLLKDGVRYSHILNPKTGWPVVKAPRSVTVVADSCIEAGVLSTVAMLKGPDAETFLESEGVRYWSVR